MEKPPAVMKGAFVTIFLSRCVVKVNEQRRMALYIQPANSPDQSVRFARAQANNFRVPSFCSDKLLWNTPPYGIGTECNVNAFRRPFFTECPVHDDNIMINCRIPMYARSPKRVG